MKILFQDLLHEYRDVEMFKRFGTRSKGTCGEGVEIAFVFGSLVFGCETISIKRGATCT